MNRFFQTALALAFAALLTGAKQPPVSCAPDLASAAAVESGRTGPLSLEDAEKIVGDNEAGPQVRIALSYILSQADASYDRKVQDLGQLFEAIRRWHYYTWSYEKFTAPDGSIGFVGDQGYFVWLRHDGKIFKGEFRIERDLNEYNEWNGNYDKMNEVPAAAKPDPRLDFIREYAEEIYADENQNQTWIDDALNAAGLGEIHVLIENSWIKNLNDKKFKDKDFVTALTNYHKTLFIEELARRPLAPKHHPYHDFKSIRLILPPPVAGAQLALLEEAFIASRERFYSSAKLKAILRAEDLDESWFRMGIGQSETQAALAARYARDNGGTKDLAYYWDPKVLAGLNSKFHEIKELHLEILKALSNSSLLVRDRQWTGLHIDVFTAARKATPQDFAATLAQLFPGTVLSQQTADLILRFARLSDEFSPSVLVAKRELLTIHETAFGAMALDFIGLGAENLRATAKALVMGKNLDHAVKLTRDFEREVTKSFEARKLKVRETVEKYFEGQVSVRFSGDDGVIVPEREISLRDQLFLIQRLSMLMPRPFFRMSMINAAGTAYSDSSQLITHAEAIEKTLRQKVLRDLGAQRSQEISMQIFIPDTGAFRKIYLIMGAKKKLNPEEKKIMRKAFPAAVLTVQEQVQAQGLSVEYEGGEIFVIYGKAKPW